MKRIARRLLLLLVSAALALGAGEAVVRIVGRTDVAGNFEFRNRVVRPYHLPVRQVAAEVKRLQESDDSILVYHRTLGWSPRPGSRSADGLYAYNSQGIRSPVPAYADRPDSGVLRIALFGDSFTHGDDVPYADSWGAVLEASLNAAGVPAEVLNFGVGGYGLDQAMLRYTTEGRRFAPQVVVLGFQPEDMKRDLNLLRPLYDPRTRLPFAKPRFILEGDGMRLIDVPVLPPDQVAPTLAHLDRWDLLPYEHFYDPADYRGTWWRKSRLLAVAADLLRPRDDPFVLERVLYRDGSEAQRVSWGVIQALAQEVAADGASFVIVHLPTPTDLDLRRRLGRWPYQTFLSGLDHEYAVAHPDAALADLAAREGMGAVYHGHFTAAGNRIVAEAVAQAVRAAAPVTGAAGSR